MPHLPGRCRRFAGINLNSYCSALSPVRHDAGADDEAHREGVLRVIADEEHGWIYVGKGGSIVLF